VGLFAEFGHFLSSHKYLLLALLLTVVVLLILLIVITGNSTIAPFTYTLF